MNLPTRSEILTFIEKWKISLQIVWATIIVEELIRITTFSNVRFFNIHFFTTRILADVLLQTVEGIIMVAIMIFGAVVLTTKIPVNFLGKNIFRYSLIGLLWAYIKGKSNNDLDTNVWFMPLKFRILRYIFVPLLIFNIPFFAAIEESIFRSGTVGWIGLNGGISRSIIFGLVHSLVGVPLACAIPTILTGIWLTAEYFSGITLAGGFGIKDCEYAGIAVSMSYHVTYNFVLISLLIILLLQVKGQNKNTTNDEK